MNVLTLLVLLIEHGFDALLNEVAVPNAPGDDVFQAVELSLRDRFQHLGVLTVVTERAWCSTVRSSSRIESLSTYL